MNYGYLDCYKLLYGTPQFPYWFIFQACYSCYVTHKSIESLRKTPNLFFRQLIIAFCMTFAPREIFAFAFKKLSPIKHNPQSIIIFLGIYGLICIKPIYKIINFFAKLIGMAQGVNVARFFTLALRNIKGIPAELILPIAIIFSVMDQLIEFIFSTIFKTKNLKFQIKILLSELVFLIQFIGYIPTAIISHNILDFILFIFRGLYLHLFYRLQTQLFPYLFKTIANSNGTNGSRMANPM